MLMGPYHWSCSEEGKLKFLEQYPPYVSSLWEFLVEHELQSSFFHGVMLPSYS
jgi:hypothetical protein